MYSPEQKKLAQKEATSRPVQEQNARTDGTDRQVNEVRENAIHKDGDWMRGDLSLYSAGEPDSGYSATPKSWVEGRLADKASTGHGHGFSDVSGVARDDHTHGQYLTENEGDDRYSRLGHTHSKTEFIQHSKRERERMLSLRNSARTVSRTTEDPEKFLLAEGVEMLCKLVMDYRDLDAYERERRFDDPEWREWSEHYKQAFGVDEYQSEMLMRYGSINGVRMDPYSGIKENGS